MVGERRFLGLYTTAAYREVPANIPVLRRKAQAVLDRAGFPPGSHDDKALVEMLDTYPRDELFQIGDDELYEIARGILELGERQRVRLFMRTDRYERFVSCLVFLPRDRFNTVNRMQIGEILREALGAERVDWGLRLTEWVLVRIHYTLHVPRRRAAAASTPAELEARIVEATRSWDDELQTALLEENGEERGTALFRRYGAAFPAAYRDDLLARSAVADIQRIERWRARTRSTSASTGRWRRRPGTLRCKLYRRGERVLALRRAADVREHGADRHRRAALPVTPREGAAGLDLRLRAAGPGDVDVDAIRDRFHEGFVRVWRGEAELDGFNGLILAAGLDWREVTMLRAVARYLRQAGIPFSDRYMEQTLLAHAGVSRRARRALPRPLRPGRRPRPRRGCVAEIEAGDRRRRQPRRGPHPARLPESSCARCCAPTTTCRGRSRTCRSSSTRRRSRSRRCRGRGSRSSCTRRASRACTCAAARSRAAACAGPTAARTSAPRSSA